MTVSLERQIEVRMETYLAEHESVLSWNIPEVFTKAVHSIGMVVNCVLRKG